MNFSKWFQFIMAVFGIVVILALVFVLVYYAALGYNITHAAGVFV